MPINQTFKDIPQLNRSYTRQYDEFIKRQIGRRST